MEEKLLTRDLILKILCVILDILIHVSILLKNHKIHQFKTTLNKSKLKIRTKLMVEIDISSTMVTNMKTPIKFML